MTFYVENEAEYEFPFDIEELVAQVADKALEAEGCTIEVEVNVLITDDEGIQEYNRQFRGIDKATDVLSFPNLDFDEKACFSIPEKKLADYRNPESGNIILGDIILSKDRILSQAQEYGHSIKREFAFLVAHSILHLCGYDHMTNEEATEMEQKQEQILGSLGITREA